MHNNYYFLQHLSRSLQQKLNGFTLVSCFSQNKDELVFEFNNAKESFFIKASLLPQFCCLNFPSSFHRARKNSIDLFPDTILKKVKGVRQFLNERSFLIELEEGLGILFKMHGQRANIVLTQENSVIGIFRNHLTADLELDLEAMDRNIALDDSVMHQSVEEWKKHFFTFGKEVWNYLESRSLSSLPPTERWKLLQETIALLNQPQFYLTEVSGKLVLSVLPIGTIKKEFTNPIEAINEFFFTFTSSDAFYTEKSALLKSVKEKITSGSAYLQKNKDKLSEIENDHHYQEWADLIMAHLHEIKTGETSITFESFYTQQPVTIKLKKDLNPQRNAEAFYRKSKNQQIEIDQLKKSISKKELEVNALQDVLQQIERADDLKTLRAISQKTGVQKKSTAQPESVPYHEFEYNGFRIWVGRNAESNDVLTLKMAYKEDLWLHAKDVAGSHVIIKYQSGKKFPKDVIERAAQLAAYNSKRKTDSLCPVLFTPKKFVRKRKGDPAGMVVVEREEVILVEPRL